MGKGDRKRRAGSTAVAAARASTSNRTSAVIGLIVVVLLAAAVVGGAIWASSRKTAQAAAPIPAVTTAPDSLAVSLDRDAGTVLVGAPSAKSTVDVYEDFLCPVCKRFEQSYGTRIQQELSAGVIRVRYHIVNLLDERSDPPGYSLRAANAALAVADFAPSRFLDFHDSLFRAQPAEGARGYENGQLIDLASRLGVSNARFGQEVADGSFAAQIKRGLAGAVADPALQRPSPSGGKSFGTPTVAVNGALVDIGDPGWLDKLVAPTPSG